MSHNASYPRLMFARRFCSDCMWFAFFCDGLSNAGFPDPLPLLPLRTALGRSEGEVLRFFEDAYVCDELAPIVCKLRSDGDGCERFVEGGVGGEGLGSDEKELRLCREVGERLSSVWFGATVNGGLSRWAIEPLNMLGDWGDTNPFSWVVCDNTLGG